MMYPNRKWCLKTVATPEALAIALTEQTWCLCAAFCVEGHPDYLFLNDSTHEDGAGEFAVLKKAHGGFIQIESVTFSWCDRARALEHILAALSGAWDQEGGRVITATIQLPEEHGRCRYCD